MTNEWVREAIAKRLKQAADEAGLNGKQVAAKLGVTPATVYRWWEAERIPKESMIERYAEVTGKETGWIQAGVYHGERLKDFTDWALQFARLIEEGMAADEAYDAVTGAPDELSLRERRELRSNTAALRRFLATLPAEEDSRRALLAQFALLLKDGK